MTAFPQSIPGITQADVFHSQVAGLQARLPEENPAPIVVQLCPLRGVLLLGSQTSPPEMNESLHDLSFFER
jgi:hypothetical protein